MNPDAEAVRCTDTEVALEHLAEKMVKAIESGHPAVLRQTEIHENLIASIRSSCLAYLALIEEWGQPTQ